MSEALTQLTALELADKIRRKAISSREAVAATFDRIDAVEPKVDAFLELNRDHALAQAETVDAAIASGRDMGRLAGVPVALKDNLCTTDFKTTCASRILENFAPPYDAHVVECLRREGAVIVGKTNLDEFAMGSSTENSGFKPTRNPWDRERIPGGSSGGSAAAVAAEMTPVALGSDTGGSIRQPASFCGVVGMKPTYGRVSRYGLVAFASSLDQIGPFAKDVRDAALMMEVIGNYDRRDSSCVDRPTEPYLQLAEAPLETVRIGVPKEYFGEGLDPEVRKAVEVAIQMFQRMGAEVKEISLPHTDYAIATYYIIAPAEASSNLARYDGVHYGHRNMEADDIISLFERSRAEAFGAEVQRRILLGTYALSSGYYDAYYIKASKVRHLIKNDFDAAFREVDCVVCPTSPIPPFKLGERTANPLEMYLADIFTLSANLAGIPGVSVPCGFTDSGLPIGLQLMANAFDDARLLQLARAYERETDWRSARRPAI